MFFAHPYASWERSTNQNANGWIRQDFPKGMDLSAISLENTAAVEPRLNDRPRKGISLKTPNEVLFASYSSVALGS